jgi:hypothetical protein
MAMHATATATAAFVSTHAPVCTVHTCGRCKRAVSSADPCSFVLAHTHVCPACRAQEEALKHLSLSRSIWGASLASLRRAA